MAQLRHAASSGRSLTKRAARMVAVAIVAVAIVVGALPTLAQGGSAPAGRATGAVLSPSAADLTRSLLRLASEYDAAPPDRRPALLADIIDIAGTRADLLAALADDNSAEVLHNAFPAAARAKLPAEAGPYLEQDTDAEGELEVLVEDHDTLSRVHHKLHSDRGETLALKFAADVPELMTGSRVRVHGVRVGDTLALDSTSASVTAVAPALPNTFGEQRTVVILVNFRDAPTQPYTPADAQSVFFTTTSNFYYEGSFQQTWLTGDVFGWFTIALDSTVCDSTQLSSLAKAAATAAGVNLSAYSRYVYAFPKNACSWWGLGSLGGNPSQAWINGTLHLMVTGHELGHNFGLYHARSLDCGDTVLGASCTSDTYGDTFDVMGKSALHFNAFNKERLGWLNYGTQPEIVTVAASGSYWLDAYESGNGMVKALKILKSVDPATGKQTWYYVEARQAIGFDASLASNANVMNGVVIRTGSEASGDTSYVLDMTPLTSSWSDPALTVGTSFSDPDAGVTIDVVSAGSSGASVFVTLVTRPSPTPTPTAPPTATATVQPTPTPTPVPLAVNASTDKSVYARGQLVTMTANVSSGSGSVAGASVTFTLSKPKGSAVTTRATTGSNGVAVASYQLKKSDPVGTYTVTAAATVAAATGRGNAKFAVQ